MRIILIGLDKNLIDLKKKPRTKFDELYKNKCSLNNPISRQIKMKVPQSNFSML